jgi:anti-anti-sigma factor
MKITVSMRNHIAVVVVSGRVDALTSKDLMTKLEHEIAAGNYRLVVDLQHVDFMSSAGVQALLTAARAAREHAGELCMAGVQPNVERVFDLSGLTHFAHVYHDVEFAIAKVRS